MVETGASGGPPPAPDAPAEGAERLEQAFSLMLDDLYEANAAVQICNGFNNKHEFLVGEPIERQQVWGFVEQAVSWKLALALERLTQRAKADRASLPGLLREIDSARKGNQAFCDEARLEAAKERLQEVMNQDACKALQASRNAFMGHSLLGKSRTGVPVLDLVDLLGKLEEIADDLHYGVFGNYPPMDEHITSWQELTSEWFEWAFPEND